MEPWFQLYYPELAFRLSRPSVPFMRADAERNKKLIVQAAREVFATAGLAAPIDEIAQRASEGSGQGSPPLDRKQRPEDGFLQAAFQTGPARRRPQGFDGRARQAVFRHSESRAGTARRNVDRRRPASRTGPESG